MNGNGMKNSYPVLTIEEVAKHNSPDSCWVIHEGRVYDVTSFLFDHPGGEEILVKHSGNDITQLFKEIGHSEHARSLLEKYYIGNLGDQLNRNIFIETSDKSKLIHKIKTRLFTKEDKFGLHKIFGSIALIGFIAAMIRLFIPTDIAGPFFAKPSFANIGLLLSHAGLAMTALVFHVPLKRHFNYVHTLENQEQRLHSIVFSMRSIVFVAWYMMIEPMILLLFPFITSYIWCLRAFLLSLWHGLADIVTYKYAGLNSTTIRGSHDGKSDIDKLGVSLASLAQLGAILVLLGFSATDEVRRSYLGDLCYLTLIPIQLVVFQITLKRKGFLSAKVNGWLYMIELFIVVIALAPGSREIFLIVLFGLLRFIFRINKYFLFLAFAFLAQHFTFAPNAWIPCILGITLLLFMQKQNQIQGFRNSMSVKCKIVEKTQLQENTYQLRLQTPQGITYKMPSGRHLALKIDENIQRFYTPISFSSDGKYFDIVAKTYPNGKANDLLRSTQIGDHLTFSGPFGNIFYAENKMLRNGNELIPLKNKKILCIAGGSGITPIYAVLAKLNKNVDVELVYINRTRQDILLQDKISELPQQINIIHYLTRENNTNVSWFNKGRYYPLHIAADIVFISGPDQFCETYKNLVSALVPAHKIIIF